MLYTVRTPTGSDLHLMELEEAEWYQDRRDRYMDQNHFPNVSDLQDLDRLLALEVMLYRWILWMARGFDYGNVLVDQGALKNSIKEYSMETRALKKALGIDKETRDKDKGESLPDYIANLLNRAKEFGYHRNEQYALVVTKFYELHTMITTFDRCDAEEREILDLSYESIFEWVRDHVLADFDNLSAEFRKNQAMWIRSM
jgi:hypothetical protein